MLPKSAVYHVSLLMLLAGSWALSFSQLDLTLQIRWDAAGYYFYLPAIVLHGDPGLSEAWVDQAFHDYYFSDTRYQFNPQPDGKQVIKYPSGLAILYAPGFFVGHLYALASDAYPADGFSPPYSVAVSLWCLLLISSGVFLFFAFLQRLFSPFTAFLTTAALLLGTNFLATAFLSPLMPHGLLFFMYVLLLSFTAKAVDGNSFRHAVAAAIVFALIALSRPSEMVALILPLVYGWGAGRGLLAKGGLLRGATARKRWLVLVGVIAVMGGIQLVYWKTTTGSWLYYSYDNPGEGLDFWSPHLRESLFSFRKGWWLYTPLALIAIVGLFHPALSRRGWRAGALLFMLLTIWIVSSWTTWWFAGSFGQRAYVQSYAVLFLGLATLIEVARESVKPLKWAAAIGLLLLIALNLFQTWQFTSGILPDDRITEAYYNAVFLRTEKPENAEQLLSVDRCTNGEIHWALRDEYRTTLDSSFVIGALPGSPPVDFPWTWEFINAERFQSDHAFVVMDWEHFGQLPQQGEFRMVTSAFHEDAVYNWRGLACSLSKDSGSVHFLTPHFRSSEDRFVVQVWNPELLPLDSVAVRVRFLEPPE
jgi:hypothetical protein